MKKLIIFGLPMLAAMGIACGSGASSDNADDTKPGATAAATKATKAPSYTKSQQQAIGKAEEYLQTQHFSKKGLIKQLEFEEFSAADAKFAVEHIKVDWNAQAAGKAKEYLDTQHFSHSGLVKQLEFDGFTQAQAEYGVKKVGL